MKLTCSLALLAALFISACTEPEPPPRRHRVATYQRTTTQTQYPAQPQPYYDNTQPPPPPPDVAASAYAPDTRTYGVNSRWLRRRALSTSLTGPTSRT
ncbi:MAG: hypothetical protein ACREP1_10880, partial [Rhodanobacteraceae bacterium]